MPLKAELFGPGEVLPAEWDRFVASQRCIRAWEAAAFEALSAAGQGPWVGMVHDGGDPVALLWGRLRGPRWLPLFECKLPLVARPGLAFAAGLDAAGARAAVTTFERALARRLRWRCRGVVYRQLTGEEAHRVQGTASLRVTTPYPHLVLPNTWSTLDEYYLSLPRKTRHRMRAQYRQLERDPELVVEMGSGPIPSAEASWLVRHTNLRYRAGSSHRPPPPAYFDALTGAGVLYVTYRHAGRLVGVGQTFDDGDWLTDSLWGGLGPREGGRPHSYFHRYLRLIAYMVESGRGGVHLCKGMPAIKQRYGAHLVPQLVVAKLR